MAATLQREVAQQQRTIQALMQQQRPVSFLDRELAEQLPRLLLVCHPDKHSNSEASTRATQWLLDVRGRLTAH